MQASCTDEAVIALLDQLTAKSTSLSDIWVNILSLNQYPIMLFTNVTCGISFYNLYQNAIFSGRTMKWSKPLLQMLLLLNYTDKVHAIIATCVRPEACKQKQAKVRYRYLLLPI